MVSKVKIFLEKYGHLVNDLEEFFDEVYDSDLEDDNIGYMCFLLDQAGIENINEYRDKSLHKVIEYATTEFGTSRDPSIQAMPIKDFIEAFLENRIGYSIDYVKLYMFKHAKEWKSVKLYNDTNNIPIIERMF